MEHPDPLPKLVRLYIRQCLIGFAISAAFTVLLLALDVAGLRGLVLGTQGGFMALFLLFFFNGLVFAGVQFAITVMWMGKDDDDDDDDQSGRRAPVIPALMQPLALPVRAGGVAGGRAGQRSDRGTRLRG